MTPDLDKQRLRSLIRELTEQMVLAWKDPEATPSLKDTRETLDAVCAVYRLLNGTGDLDTSGSALDDYRREFTNGVKHPGRGRTGNGARKRTGAVGASGAA